MYRSPPPISSTRSSTVVLRVKLAELLQILQIALSCLIFSHLGISSKTSLNGLRKEVPLSTLIITILPSLAAFSENSTTYSTSRSLDYLHPYRTDPRQYRYSRTGAKSRPIQRVLSLPPPLLSLCRHDVSGQISLLIVSCDRDNVVACVRCKFDIQALLA